MSWISTPPSPQRSVLRRAIGSSVVVLLATVGVAGPVLAQEAGTSASVVLEAESSIVIDGALDDWASVPSTVTVDGPLPSDDPGTNGRLRWQVAADPDTLFFAATITDSTIVAGQNDGAFWLEDSLELYLNFSGDLAATSYTDGVSQIRISAVDIGQTDPLALTITGFGHEQHDVSGFVFETDEGWGVEVAVGVTGLAEPAAGERFGLQVQANGSSGEGRDLKVSWSAADTLDTSFEDPSVFAQGVFVNAVVEDAAASSIVDTVADNDVGNDAPATIGAAGDTDGISGAQEVDSIVDGGPEIITADEQRRSLFFAAIASSIAVFFGGLWFERKRRADEARHAARRAAAPKSAVAVIESAKTVDERNLDPIDEDFTIDDAEFDAMLESILDDDAPTDGYEER